MISRAMLISVTDIMCNKMVISYPDPNAPQKNIDGFIHDVATINIIW